MKKILRKLHLPNWLIIILALVIILRIPSFFEPYSYGDEMIYLTLGQGIRQGVPLYSGLHDNKPPLLYLVAALAGNLFWFKTIIFFWMLGTTIVFWKLVERFFPNKQSLHKASMIIFALLTTLPLLEGNIINAELFFIGPIILGFYLFLTLKHNFKNLFLVGVLFSLASLFKIPAGFDLLVLFFLLLIQGINKLTFKKAGFILLGFLIPIAITFVWFGIKGSLSQYIEAAFLQNLGYVSSWRGRNLPLIIRGGTMLLGLGLLYFLRRRLSKPFILTSAWLLTSLFATTLSERPYPHYLLQAVAPIAILTGMLFSLKNLEQSLVVIPLALAAFVPFYFKFWYYPTGAYYGRFINFVLGKTSQQQYLSSFSPRVSRNYEIASFLSQSCSPKGKVFVWSTDAPTIYALSRRLPPVKYVANYHIKDFYRKDLLVKDLATTKPKFIVITYDESYLTQAVPLLRESYLLINKIEDGEIWSRID